MSCLFVSVCFSLTRHNLFCLQGGSKLERARDLFEQCLEGAPPKYAKSKCSLHLRNYTDSAKNENFTNLRRRIGVVVAELYLLYAQLEEEHGLARHAMAVYERATQAVLPEEQYEVRPQFCPRSKSSAPQAGKFRLGQFVLGPNSKILFARTSPGQTKNDMIGARSKYSKFTSRDRLLSCQMFNIYIKRAAEIYGVTHTRPIYEKALEALKDEQARCDKRLWASTQETLGFHQYSCL